jgi:hypothetical protein
MDPNQDRAVQAAFDGRIPAKEDQLRDNTIADRLRQAVLGDAAEAAVAMHEAADEIERLRSRLECPTCAERGYDNTDYHRLHRAWCDSVAEIERLREALRLVLDTVEGCHDCWSQSAKEEDIERVNALCGGAQASSS